jgi:hypothetical protein
MSSVVHGLMRWTTRAASVLLPAIWHQLIWPGLKFVPSGLATWLIVRAGFDIPRIVLAEDHHTLAAQFTAGSLGVMSTWCSHPNETVTL